MKLIYECVDAVRTTNMWVLRDWDGIELPPNNKTSDPHDPRCVGIMSASMYNFPTQLTHDANDSDPGDRLVIEITVVPADKNREASLPDEKQIRQTITNMYKRMETEYSLLPDDMNTLYFIKTLGSCPFQIGQNTQLDQTIPRLEKKGIIFCRPVERSNQSAVVGLYNVTLTHLGLRMLDICHNKLGEIMPIDWWFEQTHKMEMGMTANNE